DVLLSRITCLHDWNAAQVDCTYMNWFLGDPGRNDLHLLALKNGVITAAPICLTLQICLVMYEIKERNFSSAPE
ncbi:hypothetical protein HHI36_018001, partial [Cryptolaemus montrouzieri]